MGSSSRSVKDEARAKAEAEVRSLEARGVRMAGCAFPAILFVKGIPNAAEAAGESPLSGADGEALFKAISALGYAPEDWAAVLTVLADGSPVFAGLLRETVNALSPLTLVATDDAARRVLCEAFADDLTTLADLNEALLEPGVIARVAGLRVMSLGGFEAALGDPAAKQLMWARLKRLPPLGEPY